MTLTSIQRNLCNLCRHGETEAKLGMLSTIKDLGDLLARNVLWLHPLMQGCIALQLQSFVQTTLPKWMKAPIPGKVNSSTLLESRFPVSQEVVLYP